MALFKYRAKNQSNQTVEGTIESNTESSAADELAARSLIVVSLKEAKKSGNFLQNFDNYFNRLSKKDLAIFLRQLSVLISASIPLVQALKILSEQSAKKTLRETLLSVAVEVEGGSKLSTALAAYPGIFTRFFVSMIKSGESSGKLDDVLLYLADQQEKDYELETKIGGAMIYPAVIISLLVVVGVVMIVFVLPKMLSMFTEMGPNVVLPLPTRMLISFVGFTSAYWVYIFIVLIAAFIGLRFFLSQKAGRAFWDELKLKIPVVGNMFMYIYIVRFSRSTATLLQSGLTVPDSLKIVKEIVGNYYFEELLVETLRSVEEGNQISATFQKEKLLPRMVPQMISVGEQTGKLEEVLNKITDFYVRELNTVVGNLLTLMEPVILIILGLAVGVMVSAILMPMYTVMGQI